MTSNNPNRLKELRENKKMSGTELAELLGISPQYYYDLEKGDRRLNENLIKRLAEIFQVSSDYILGISNNNINNNDNEINELKRVDPDLLIEICRAKDLPDEERRRIKEFAAFEIEKFLRDKKKNGNK